MGTPHTIALDQDMQRALGALSGKAPDPDVESFLLNLAICNTVVPNEGPDGKPIYQVRPGVERS